MDETDKLGEPRAVRDLPAAELERRTNDAIAQLEEARPEVWYFFLYEQGLHSVLGRFLATSPFQGSPILMAIERELARFNPDLSSWNVSQLRREIQKAVTDELISKHLDFSPPHPHIEQPRPEVGARRVTCRALVIIIGVLLVGSLLIFVAAETFGKGLSSRDMDWNDDGRMSVGEFSHAFDVGVRDIHGKPCREVYALKDGLSVRELCP
jgi:hypothetical protein